VVHPPLSPLSLSLSHLPRTLRAAMADKPPGLSKLDKRLRRGSREIRRMSRDTTKHLEKEMHTKKTTSLEEFWRRMRVMEGGSLRKRQGQGITAREERQNMGGGGGVLLLLRLSRWFPFVPSFSHTVSAPGGCMRLAGLMIICVAYLFFFSFCCFVCILCLCVLSLLVYLMHVNL